MNKIPCPHCQKHILAAQIVCEYCGFLVNKGHSGQQYATDTVNPDIQAQGYEVEFVAGHGLPGFVDDQGTKAYFDHPTALVIDPTGYLYVADTGNHCIRKVSLNGVVRTLAGGKGSGFADGVADNALFKDPVGLSLDKQGNLYVADKGNHRIRKVTLDGKVSTIAGSAKGCVDGPADQARFKHPTGVAMDKNGCLWIADYGNQAIRKITPEGTVSTVAACLNAGMSYEVGFWRPYYITLDDQGNVYTLDKHLPVETGRRLLYRLERIGRKTTWYIPGQSVLGGFVVADGGKVIYAAGLQQHCIYTFSLDDKATPKNRIESPHMHCIAGRKVPGMALGLAGQFNCPTSLTLDPKGYLYIADTGNHRICRIKLPHKTPSRPSSPKAKSSGINPNSTMGSASQQDKARATLSLIDQLNHAVTQSETPAEYARQIRYVVKTLVPTLQLLEDNDPAQRRIGLERYYEQIPLLIGLWAIMPPQAQSRCQNYLDEFLCHMLLRLLRDPDNTVRSVCLKNFETLLTPNHQGLPFVPYYEQGHAYYYKEWIDTTPEDKYPTNLDAYGKYRARQVEGLSQWLKESRKLSVFFKRVLQDTDSTISLMGMIILARIGSHQAALSVYEHTKTAPSVWQEWGLRVLSYSPLAISLSLMQELFDRVECTQQTSILEGIVWQYHQGNRTKYGYDHLPVQQILVNVLNNVALEADIRLTAFNGLRFINDPNVSIYQQQLLQDCHILHYIEQQLSQKTITLMDLIDKRYEPYLVEFLNDADRDQTISNIVASKNLIQNTIQPVQKKERELSQSFSLATLYEGGFKTISFFDWAKFNLISNLDEIIETLEDSLNGGWKKRLKELFCNADFCLKGRAFTDQEYRYSVETLSHCPDPQLIAILIECLSQKNRRKEFALDILFTESFRPQIVQYPEFFPLLYTCLKDPLEIVRIKAARLLVYLGDSKGVSILEAALNSQLSESIYLAESTRPYWEKLKNETQSQQAAYENALKSLREEAIRWQQAYEASQAKLGQLEQQKAEAQCQHQQEKTTWERNSIQSQDHIQALTQQLDRKNQDLADLKQELLDTQQSLNHKLTQLQQDNQTLKDQNTTLKAQFDSLQQEKETVQQRINQLEATSQHQKTHYEEKIDTLQKELEQLRNQHDYNEVTTERNDLRTENQQLKMNKRDLINEIEKLRRKQNQPELFNKRKTGK